MRYHHQSNTPPGRGSPRRARPFIAVLVLFLPIAASLHAQANLEKTADLPDWRLILWDTVVRPDLTWFGWCSAPLSDINGDGYDDLAVSSQTDTTYIFLGGDPFPHDHAFIVRGGSSWIASADFNRDGKMDLVTAIQDGVFGETTAERRGAIRIYLQKDGPAPFIWEPDLLIEGEPFEYLGLNLTNNRGAIAVLDFNGDGWPDLFARSADSRDSVKSKGLLFLGGPDMDARHDAEFRLPAPQTPWQFYLNDLLVGDINGDGCDDVLINDQYGVNNVPVFYWDLYLGNPQARVGVPDRVLRSDGGWSPEKRISGIMDIDADGYADIIDAGPNSLHRILGDALFFRGKPNLPPVLFPDDSIPNRNPRPIADLSPQIVCPVGDMNGDGIPDLVMAWNTYFGAGASVYYFYPGGSKFRTSLGYFGTSPELDRVEMGVYPAGDLNGDGFDDVITLGRGSKSGLGNRFQIWLGSSQLKTPIELLPSPAGIDLSVAPNPLTVQQRHVTVVARGLRPGSAELAVTDLLGRIVNRVHLDSDTGILHHALDLGDVAAGLYLLTLRQGTDFVQEKLTVY